MPNDRAEAGNAELAEAMIAVASDLSLPTVLERIVRSASVLVDARYGALGVIGDDHLLSDFVTCGIDAETIEAIGALPVGKGILGRLIADPQPLRLADLSQHPDSSGFPPGHPPMRSFLGVPIRVRDQVFGNLYLCEKRSRAEFTAEDEAHAIALAVAAGVAIENARLHQKIRALAVLEDRERIARDLHDKVIQQLFATGMSLQATEPLTREPRVAERLHQAIDDLDLTIREIRNTIFALHPPSTGLRAELAQVVSDIGERFGAAVALRIDGPLDHAVPPEIADHVVPVVREAVSNAAHHADATRIAVDVAVGANLTVSVSDDGVGMPLTRSGGGEGLRNLARRAESQTGTLTINARDGGGTIVTWCVPLDA